MWWNKNTTPKLAYVEKITDHIDREFLLYSRMSSVKEGDIYAVSLGIFTIHDSPKQGRYINLSERNTYNPAQLLFLNDYDSTKYRIKEL